MLPHSAGIIAREVKFCHPQKPVNVVWGMLIAFKTAIQDTAEFWLYFKERKIHIRYFASCSLITRTQYKT